MSAVPHLTQDPVHAIDLFCGGGGTTTGIERAYAAAGRPVALLGINHDELACQTYARNHPLARTLCQRLQHIANPRSLIPGGRAHLLAASAECTNHTKAANGLPRDDQSRSTMSEIIRFAEATQPEYIFGENVPEVRLWGPLDEHLRPDRSQLRVFFNAWCEHFRLIGYRNLEYRIVRCADYGDPTFRSRLIIMASRDAAPIRWPAPTHGPAGSGLLPYRTTREIIEWQIPGTLIGEKRRAGYFARKAERWACIEAGLALYDGAPFVLRRRQHDNPPASNAKSIDEPLHTVTTKSTDIALIVPDGRDIDRARHRMLLPIELQRAMSFPDEYVFMGANAGEQVHQIGNAVPVWTAYAHIAALLGLPQIPRAQPDARATVNALASRSGGLHRDAPVQLSLAIPSAGVRRMPVPSPASLAAATHDLQREHDAAYAAGDFMDEGWIARTARRIAIAHGLSPDEATTREMVTGLVLPAAAVPDAPQHDLLHARIPSPGPQPPRRPRPRAA